MLIDDSIRKYTDTSFKEILQELMPESTSVSVSVSKIEVPFEISLLSYLLPEERALLKESSVLKRKKEFFLGRLAATDAVLLFDNTATCILKNQIGAPLWCSQRSPQSGRESDYVGSISHCGDFAVSVVGRSIDYSLVGVDIISAQRKTHVNLLETLCGEAEMLSVTSQWNSTEGLNNENLLRLFIFSVKESLYKAFSNTGFVKMEWQDLNIVKFTKEKDRYVFTMFVSDSLRAKSNNRSIRLPDYLEIHGIRHLDTICTWIAI